MLKSPSHDRAPARLSTSPAAIDTAGNKAIAYRAQKELLVDKDMHALDRYWGDYYIQHNPALRNGLPELKIFKNANVPAATTELLRCFADRDLVFFQERVSGLMPFSLCFFDVYRIEEGKIVEHWDAHQESHGPNPAGRTIFDGPTDIHYPDQTEATRAVVTTLISRVFILDQMDLADRYVARELIQHTPGAQDGLAELYRRFLEAQWFTGAIRYIALRRVIAEGEFALTCSQGEIGGVPHVLYDLWRVADSMVVEHWGLSQQAKPSPYHRNPMI
jgi:predicted SnoaL-like aldol condensation-catalyzing enzyme